MMATTTNPAPGNRSQVKDNLRLLSFEGEDDELVRAMRQGDLRAAGALVDRYGRYVERLVAHLMGADPAIPDLVQEIFTRAITDIRRLRQPELLKFWLRGIAVNTVRSELRRRTRWSWFAFLDPQTLSDVPAPEGESETDLLESVRIILDHMPVDERMILCLRYFDELEQLEIGRTLGISLATVKRRLDRAIERFTLLAGREPSLSGYFDNRQEEAP